VGEDKKSDSTVAEPIVYLLRETYGLWTVTLGTSNGDVPIAYVREWNEALTAAVQRACAEQAALLLVDGAGTARWIPREEL
jgi:hypothetical protein